jgi:hypothetical protein
MENFQKVLTRLRRNQKQELKNMTDEWENKVINYQTENANDYKRKVPVKRAKRNAKGEENNHVLK